MRRTLVLWGILAALYGGFRLWYDGGGGPLTPEEVKGHLAAMQEQGSDPAQLAALREFLAADAGGDFVMANFVRFREGPEAEADMDRYMAYMMPALLRRACHPVFAGPVVADALDLWGVEDARRWSLVGLVRYRSRRDLLEIAANPAFREVHPFKEKAMQQTIAVPVEPDLLLGSPRSGVALGLLTLGALLQLALRGRRARSRPLAPR
jgi:hypothetical protein